MGNAPSRARTAAQSVAQAVRPTAGPLVGPGRLVRAAPYVAVAALAVMLAGLGEVKHTGLFTVAIVLVPALLFAAAALPWRRWPAGWQATVPLTALAVVLLVRFAGGPGAGYLPLTTLPILWLALHHARRYLLIGLVELALGLVLPPLLSDLTYPSTEWRRILLTVAMAVLLGAVVQNLVDRVRRGTLAIADANARTEAERNFVADVLHGAGSLVTVLDRRGRIILYNRLCEAVLGYSAAEVTGRHFWRTGLRPEHFDSAQAVIGQLQAGQGPVSYEDDWLHRDGDRRRIAWTVTALYSPGGEISHFVATGHDVTAQRQTERLFSYVRSAGTEYAIFATDVDGIFTVFNAGAEKLFGYTADELIGQEYLTILYPAEYVAERMAEIGVTDGVAALVQPVRTGAPYSGEATLVRHDGTRLPVSMSFNAIRDERDRLLGFLATARDITAEQQAAALTHEALQRQRLATTRLRELNQIQADFVSTVSHELRTPLTSILGNMEILLDGDAGEMTTPQRKILTAAERNANRLLTLVNDLLMVSRLESRADVPDSRILELHEVIDTVLEVLGPAAKDVRVQLRRAGKPLYVIGDPRGLEQVMINIVGNAIKFTSAGDQVTVTIGAAEGTAVITVADTGLGIPEADLPHIFERFYRSSVSQHHETQGSGLGLAIAQAIVKQHGGWITADSVLGQGATFAVHLPLANPDSYAPAAEGEDAGTTRPIAVQSPHIT